MKQFNELSHRDGLEIEIGVTVSDTGLSWYYSEHMQFYEGDLVVQNQSFAEYRAFGPPEFAKNIRPTFFQDIDNALHDLER